MSKIFTKEQIIERFNNKHKNKYSYEKFDEYSSQKKSITINCPIHGDFVKGIQKHLLGQGCPKCQGRGKTTEDIIKEFKLLHGEKYDYSKLIYVNPYKHMTIICPEHGEFLQTYHQHTKETTKNHCQKCKSIDYALSKENIIERFISIHGDIYDYSNVEKQISIQNNVEIICKDHGSFFQRIDNHFMGKGCPKCFCTGPSKLELEVLNYVKTLDSEVLSGDKTMIGKKEIDILSHNFKIGIEFNGLNWHKNAAKRHLEKTNLVENTGYQLIQIYEDDWLFKKDIVKSRLKNLFQKSEKIFARKTIIKTITSKQAKEFFNKNHIQGNVEGKYYFGLFFNGELVAAMSFSNRSILGNSEIELLRYASKLHTNIVGGASKLLKYFIKLHKPNEIISFADRSWSKGNLYEKLGFDFLYATKPNYYYIHERKRQPRYRFQKHKLVEQGFDASKTEKEIMIERGFDLIYDSGSLKYKLTL